MFNNSKRFLSGFLLCMVALSNYWSICSAHQPAAVIEPIADANDCPDNARDLCIEFRDLRDLIPSNTLAYITARHYRSDSKFRKAMKFLHTAAFADATKQIEDSEVYQQLMQPFADAGVDTEIISSITAILDCLMLSDDVYAEGRSIDVAAAAAAAAAPRSLASYGREVLASMPRKEFKHLLKQNLDKNTQFAAFYRIMRNNTFQRLVMNALTSSELQKPLRVLNKHYIDVRQLLSEAFELFSYGPSDF